MDVIELLLPPPSHRRFILFLYFIFISTSLSVPWLGQRYPFQSWVSYFFFYFYFILFFHLFLFILRVPWLFCSRFKSEGCTVHYARHRCPSLLERRPLPGGRAFRNRPPAGARDRTSRRPSSCAGSRDWDSVCWQRDSDWWVWEGLLQVHRFDHDLTYGSDHGLTYGSDHGLTYGSDYDLTIGSVHGLTFTSMDLTMDLHMDLTMDLTMALHLDLTMDLCMAVTVDLRMVMSWCLMSSDVICILGSDTVHKIHIRTYVWLWPWTYVWIWPWLYIWLSPPPYVWIWPWLYIWIWLTHGSDHGLAYGLTVDLPVRPWI